MNYTHIIQQQREYFNSNKSKNVDYRIDQLKKLKSVIMNHEEALYEAIYNDFKKSPFDTYVTELGFIYHELDQFIKMLPKWTKPIRTRTNLVNLPARSYRIAEPLGVCLIMGAWNYPYQLTLLPAISAMAAGNTVVLKPSEIPSTTSSIMATMINDHFDSSYIHVVEGGIKETTELLENKFDKIFFTGSTHVGRIVYQAAAKFLTPVTLELGGKSPAIVTKTSPLKDTARRIVWGKFLNAGQTCISPDYVMVDEEVEEELLSNMKAFIQKFDYSFENNNYVQIINERNFHRLANLIDKSKIYYGGEMDLQKRYIAPTLLRNISVDDPIMKEEIFGPLLPVISYKDLNEVVSIINSNPRPLACYIFTQNGDVKEKLLNEIPFGGGVINDTMMHFSNPHLPFGGVGDSGIGHYHGEAGFAAFSHYKGILDKGFFPEPNLKYPPYTRKKLSWLKWLIAR